jgi:hypothetical protein
VVFEGRPVGRPFRFGDDVRLCAVTQLPTRDLPFQERLLQPRTGRKVPKKSTIFACLFLGTNSPTHSFTYRTGQAETLLRKKIAGPEITQGY